MTWTLLLILVIAIRSAHQQCISPSDDVTDTSTVPSLLDITNFGLNLFKRLVPEDSKGNFFFSPYSIWSALTMAYFGSGGNTQRQMEAVLRVFDKASAMKLWRTLERVYYSNQEESSYDLNLANRIYFGERLKLRQCVKDVLSKELRSVDFLDRKGTAKQINNYVSNATKGHISKIISPLDLIDAIMVLVNAAFFKGTWQYQFRPSETNERNFSVSPGQRVKVPMMIQERKFKTGKSKQIGARVLELPYSGNGVSMIILLPVEDKPLGPRFDNMVENLNANTLQSALNSLTETSSSVHVQLPKFKFSVKIEEKLMQALKVMGMTDVFDQHLANLTNFSPEGGLSLSKTIHKAFIEIDEEGTEASAATTLVVESRSRAIEPQRFYCDEPFVFIIQDNKTKNILFMGAMKNPLE